MLPQPGSRERPVTVCLCFPIEKELDPYTWRSLNYLVKPKKAGPTLFGLTHAFDVIGQPIDVARKSLVEGALSEPEVTHLMWIDSDMVFPPDALARLLAHDIPIVGGLCHNRRPPFQPILAKRFGPSWGFPPLTHGWCYSYPAGLFEVDATGAGFLLVKREVFETIEKAHPGGKWWDRIPEWPEGSEDFCFCVRAKEAGFKIYVDTTLDIGHRGTVTIDAAFAKRHQKKEWNVWFPESPEQTRAAVLDGKPIVSIVIPTYNQNPQWLKAAVISAIGQTIPCEVIVVDDGTTDYAIVSDAAPMVAAAAEAAGQKVVRLPRGVTLLRHPANQGIATSLNDGIGAMTTDWFCWLPSDDLFHPRKVEVQLAATRQAMAKASYHPYSAIDAQGTATARNTLYGWKSIPDQMAHLSQVCAINGATVMVHRSVFAEVGLFDPIYRYGQDWEMWLRIGQKFQWLGVPDVLATRREHSNLTEAIAHDKEKATVRDAEDARIREKYRQEACPACGQARPVER